MKYHAQFYRLNLARNMQPALGDRAVIILDGRMSHEKMDSIAVDECKKRGYDAYQLMRGDRFTTSVPAGPMYNVRNLE